MKATFIKFYSIPTILLTLFSLHTLAADEQVNKEGQVLFENKCAKCHGMDGARGRFGAKNLQKSVLSEAGYFSIIHNGKGIMPSWKKKLSTEDIGQIVTYVKSLRKSG